MLVRLHAWVRIGSAITGASTPNPTLERRCSVKGKEPQVEPALRHQIFEHFARPPKIERAVRLVLGDADRAVLRVIELLQHYDMTSAVENDDRHGPIVFHRLGLGSRHHFLGRIETNRRTVGRCRWRRWRRRLLGDGSNDSTCEEYGCNNKRS